MTTTSSPHARRLACDAEARAAAIVAELGRARRDADDETWAEARGHMIQVEEVDTGDHPGDPRMWRWCFGPVIDDCCYVADDGCRRSLDDAWQEGCDELAAFLVGG